jgi:hypothetical protein
MNQKLEADYVAFIRKLAARSLPEGTLGETAKVAAIKELVGIHNSAKDLHQKLIDSGYGK